LAHTWINIENIYKYLQPEKIKRIYQSLALFKKSGGFEKYWRFSKNQADLKNIGAFQKIRLIWKILALYRKSGGFTKYWCLAEKQADDRILAGIKIPASGEKPAELEKAGGLLTV
jgi:hypothetical protein